MSQALAALALSFFSLAFLSALRSRWIARRSGGYARQMRWHHWLGLLCLLLVCAHVGLELAASFPLYLSSLFDIRDPALLSGWGALLSLIYGIWRASQQGASYSVWYRRHLAFILSFFLAGLHSFLFVRDGAPAWLQAWVYLALASSAGLLLIIFGSKIKNPSMARLAVERVTELSPQVFELLLQGSSPSTASRYRAGQIVFLQFQSPGFSHAWHPFSVASCRHEPHLRLLIKGLGHDTQQLAQLLPDATVRVWGPFAAFADRGDGDQMWIAGGIGLAPFWGHMHCPRSERQGRICLLHFSSEATEESLEDLCAPLDCADIEKHRLYTPRGQLPDLSLIAAHAAALHEPRYLVCGPPPFMRFVRRHLRSLGIPRGRIFTEETFR